MGVDLSKIVLVNDRPLYSGAASGLDIEKFLDISLLPLQEESSVIEDEGKNIADRASAIADLSIKVEDLYRKISDGVIGTINNKIPQDAGSDGFEYFSLHASKDASVKSLFDVEGVEVALPCKMTSKRVFSSADEYVVNFGIKPETVNITSFSETNLSPVNLMVLDKIDDEVVSTDSETLIRQLLDSGFTPIELRGRFSDHLDSVHITSISDGSIILSLKINGKYYDAGVHDSGIASDSSVIFRDIYDHSKSFALEFAHDFELSDKESKDNFVESLKHDLGSIQCSLVQCPDEVSDTSVPILANVEEGDFIFSGFDDNVLRVGPCEIIGSGKGYWVLSLDLDGKVFNAYVNDFRDKEVIFLDPDSYRSLKIRVNEDYDSVELSPGLLRDFVNGINDILGIKKLTQFTISADDTLYSLRSKISDACEGLGIMSDIQGSNSVGFNLVIKSSSVGLDSRFTTDAQSFNYFFDICEPRNSRVIVDGEVFSSDRNTLVGVLPGVDITLLRDMPEGYNVKTGIKVDVGALIDDIKDFCEIYNDLQLFIAQQSELTEDGDFTDSAILHGDLALDFIDKKLRESVVSAFRINDANYYIYSSGLRVVRFNEEVSLDYNGIKFDEDLFRRIYKQDPDLALSILQSFFGKLKGLISEDNMSYLFDSRLRELETQRRENLREQQRHEDEIVKQKEVLVKKYGKMEQEITSANSMMNMLRDQIRIESSSNG